MGPPVAGEEPSLEHSGAAGEASPSEPSPVSVALAAETQDPGPGTGRPRSNSSKSRLRHRSRTIHERLNRSRRRRASDQPFLSMPLEQYVEMVQWAANQLLAGQDRPPPPELASRLRDRFFETRLVGAGRDSACPQQRR